MVPASRMKWVAGSALVAGHPTIIVDYMIAHS